MLFVIFQSSETVAQMQSHVVMVTEMLNEHWT